jgi:MFS family permease
VAAFSVGLAIAAFPAALLMQRIGRKAGLLWGAMAGVAGPLVAAGGIATGSFWLFAFGLLLSGVAGAFVQQYRFAAAQSVAESARSTAISRVMIGGLLTALAAPQIINLTRDAFDPTPFAGAFVAMSVVGAVGLLCLTLLRFPPRPVVGGPVIGDPPRPFAEIVLQTRFLVALLCAASSFALMSFVMTAAPLAMVVHHHHTQSDAVLGIQWHVIAMFAPSFFTGGLIRRFGKETIAGTGLALLILSALIGLAGVEILHFWGMLIVLGLGWNFGFIGGTALLTETYRPSERGRIEGFNDLVVFGTVAAGSLLSGTLLNSSGWTGINVVVLPVAGVALALLVFLAVHIRRRVA